MVKTIHLLIALGLVAVAYATSPSVTTTASTDTAATDTCSSGSCSDYSKRRRASPFGVQAWDSLFHWPTFDLFDIAPFSRHHNTGTNLTPREQTGASLGAVDVIETDKDFQIIADTPGMTSKDIHVEIKGNLLTISGERKEEHREESADKRLYRLERSHSSFNRSFRVPTNADANSVRASCQDGVLKVTLPKKQEKEAQGVRIDISDTH